MNPDFTLSVLLHPEANGAWVAQCLEVDLAVQAPTADEAKSRFMQMLVAQVSLDLADGKPLLTHLGPAPQRYLDQSRLVKKEGPPLPVYVLVSQAQPQPQPQSRVLATTFLEAA